MTILEQWALNFIEALKKKTDTKLTKLRSQGVYTIGLTIQYHNRHGTNVINIMFTK